MKAIIVFLIPFFLYLAISRFFMIVMKLDIFFSIIYIFGLFITIKLKLKFSDYNTNFLLYLI